MLRKGIHFYMILCTIQERCIPRPPLPNLPGAIHVRHLNPREQYISKWLHLFQYTEPYCYRTLNGHLYGTLSNPHLPSLHTQRARGENQALDYGRDCKLNKVTRIDSILVKKPLYLALERTSDFRWNGHLN